MNVKPLVSQSRSIQLFRDNHPVMFIPDLFGAYAGLAFVNVIIAGAYTAPVQMRH